MSGKLYATWTKEETSEFARELPSADEFVNEVLEEFAKENCCSREEALRRIRLAFIGGTMSIEGAIKRAKKLSDNDLRKQIILGWAMELVMISQEREPPGHYAEVLRYVDESLARWRDRIAQEFGRVDYTSPSTDVVITDCVGEPTEPACNQQARGPSG